MSYRTFQCLIIWYYPHLYSSPPRVNSGTEESLEEKAPPFISEWINNGSTGLEKKILPQPYHNRLDNKCPNDISTMQIYSKLHSLTVSIKVSVWQVNNRLGKFLGLNRTPTVSKRILSSLQTHSPRETDITCQILRNTPSRPGGHFHYFSHGYNGTCEWYVWRMTISPKRPYYHKGVRSNWHSPRRLTILVKHYNTPSGPGGSTLNILRVPDNGTGIQ